MAVGTLLGSSLFNLLILAALDLSLPSQRRMLSAYKVRLTPFRRWRVLS